MTGPTREQIADELEYRVRTAVTRARAAEKNNEQYPREFVDRQIANGRARVLALLQNTEPVELEAFLDPKDALLDQGVTRLQLLAFLRGDHSERWNGTDVQWIRYRAHQVDRETTPDGTTIRLMYVGIRDANETATFEAAPGSDQDAAVTLRIIDTIIDGAIAHHGPDGVA